eukprot:m.428128 g.428128  ORF g.428128 m.428128 type:complete len:472 (+) comp21372_c0_seq2:294-1709(+)
MDFSRFQLDEASLKKDPEEIFDVLNKLGEGSYGSVHKAIHRESQNIVAVKKIPLDTDLIEIIREIKVLGENDHPNVVRYYGSYLKESHLWIIMEFCGVGSVADVMRLLKKPMTEPQIACIFSGTVMGLQYLHSNKTIHRDVKAGNVLLTSEGLAKLADFGVAGQLSTDSSKRNTVIGTPFWMAPEVIEETGYGVNADIWSLGITAIEMADGKPPYADVHPMRAMFMIPANPPPTLAHPEKWSPIFVDFLAQCLVKKPEQRATSTTLLQHKLILNAGNPGVVLGEMIDSTMRAMESGDDDNADGGDAAGDDDDADFGTMVVGGSDTASGTLVMADAGTMVVGGTDDASYDSGTMADMNTMVETADTGTTVALGTSVAVGGDNSSYKPSFMQYFKDQEPSGDNDGGAAEKSDVAAGVPRGPLSSLSIDELKTRLAELGPEKEREIAALRKRYEAKRRPIVEALEAKKKGAGAS